MGGSSSGGKVEWADYLEREHEVLLESANLIMQSYLHGEGYADWNRLMLYGLTIPTMTSYDPQEWFGDPNTTAWDAYKMLKHHIEVVPIGDLMNQVSLPKNMEGSELVREFGATTKELLGDLRAVDWGDGLASTWVNAMHDQQKRLRDERDIPAFEAGAATANAVMSSIFVLGRASIHNQFSHDLWEQSGELRSKLRIGKLDTLSRLAAIGMGQQSALIGMDVATSDVQLKKLAAQIEWRENVIKLLDGVASDAYTAQAKWAAITTEHEFKRWNMPWDLMSRYSEILASITGAVPIRPTEFNTTSAVMSGAFGGAAMGASTTGTWKGAAVGAGVGAGTMLLGSLLQ